ncbi:MAG TPA: TadE/TadG family type IV pilus assembly protein [Acidimicrobiales bacterium]|nr:TadE/TadG family type IV pilus assembly protein [Acidimicrobiales bacterium]
MSPPTRQKPERFRGDRGTTARGDQGSVLVELALVLPFLTVLVLGVFEFGTAWRDRSILTTALRAGDRFESQGPAQNVLSTDYYALQTFYATASQMQNVTLTKLIVYRSTAANGAPPSTCVSISPTGAPPTAGWGVAGSCIVYNQSQINTAASGTYTNFGCPASGATSPGWDSNWCVTSRNDSSPNPDYVGMYAVYSYTPVTRLISGTLTFTETAVYRIEPTQ